MITKVAFRIAFTRRTCWWQIQKYVRFSLLALKDKTPNRDWLAGKKEKEENKPGRGLLPILLLKQLQIKVMSVDEKIRYRRSFEFCVLDCSSSWSWTVMFDSLSRPERDGISKAVSSSIAGNSKFSSEGRINDIFGNIGQKFVSIFFISTPKNHNFHRGCRRHQ